ncbi:hypothetical protein AX17_000268 [Amanita inopinata Kibby_2008]|nr:hypothetical protein AX17_000268 [Amanita inopinata Kibby_2008]
MSEDDRAAKAARAKAMLNRRRQQKVGAPQTSGSESNTLVSQAPLPASSPAPSEQLDSDKFRDPAELFSRTDSDTSLPRVAPPVSHVSRVFPPPQATSPNALPVANGKSECDNSLHDQIASLKSENATLHVDVEHIKSLESNIRETNAQLKKKLLRFQEVSNQREQERGKLETLLENERQTISLLVSEKSTLTTELHRLEEVESKAREYETLWLEERTRTKAMEDQMARLQSDFHNASDTLQHLQVREKELADRCRDQERQLQLANGSISELRKDADTSQRRVRELEEQIQSDDRVEHLEESLKNTQNRTDELEFQLSKLRQVHATLKSEYDNVERQCHALQEKESEWERKYAILQDESAKAGQELVSIDSERRNLMLDKSSLQSQVEKAESSILELRGMLDKAASELATQARQLQILNGDLRAAIRRADEAERIQKDLQNEGTNLMRSLDEMRPKIVELTSEKLNLTEKVESLELSLRDRESVIAQLESSLEEARIQLSQTSEQWQAKWAQRDAEHVQALSATSDIQKAHDELQDQLDNALGSLRNLESERATHHQELTRMSNAMERLKATITTQKGELSALKKDAESRSLAQEEAREFLDRAQDEIERLQSELDTREEECERLRKYASSPKSDESHSLNDELLDTLRQQHALDLSAAQSQIRALEDSVFNAGAKTHTLQKQVAFLEDQISHSHIAARVGHRSFSPAPSRPASRNESDLRRSSFGSHRASNLAAPPLSRPAFDQDLSPETRHKRKISLSMLKARIDSEMAAATSQASSRPLSPVNSLPSNSSQAGSPPPHIRRPRFLDESHVFWCSSCRGDLVVL